MFRLHSVLFFKISILQQINPLEKYFKKTLSFFKKMNFVLKKSVSLQIVPRMWRNW